MWRYAVIRFPTSGPPALVDVAHIFDSEIDARERLRELEATQLKQHHTYLDVVAFNGKAHEELPKLGILF